MCGNRNFHGYMNATNVTCPHSLKGYSVKITVIGMGEMEMCKVAVYGSYGQFTMNCITYDEHVEMVAYVHTCIRVLLVENK